MKLTTKLLLGATVVAGLSISAFAACATDVDFGGTKKITGLADGTADGDAVNKGQLDAASAIWEVTPLVCDGTIQHFTASDGNGVYRFTGQRWALTYMRLNNSGRPQDVNGDGGLTQIGHANVYVDRNLSDPAITHQPWQLDIDTTAGNGWDYICDGNNYKVGTLRGFAY